MEETLYQYNPWWDEAKFQTNTYIREKYHKQLKKSLLNKYIIFLIGMRRVGKTTLIKQLITYLLNTIDSKHILYLSCEHPKFEEKTLIEIINEYRGYFKISRNEQIYVFFDEVQLKENFERDLKIIFDNEPNVKLFATGSSATLLKDKKAYLTGRQRTIEIEPLNFEEFIQFKEIKIKKSESYLYENVFLKFMKIGGMPEYVLNNDQEYLLNLIDTILHKDIISFYKLKNPKLIKDLFLLLCERVGKPLSYNKLAKVLGTTVDTVSQYVSYFEESFLIYIVHKYTKSLNERIRAQKKIYINDVGIRNILIGFKDLGAIYENLVFLSIKKDKPEYYYEFNKEIDFIVEKDDLAIEAKFKKKIEEKELETINKSKFKNKIIAKDYTYFLK